MSDLSRVPVIVGGGQYTNREEDPVTAPNPFELMAEATKRANADGGAGWIERLSHCWMVHSISVRHGDPATELARTIGAPQTAETRCSGMGGNIPQWLVNRAADLIRAGSRPVVLIAGSEALATKRRAKRAGVKLAWPSADGWPDMWPPLEPDMGVHSLEDANGLRQATTMYALVESAIAHSERSDQTTHMAAVGALMEGLNSVAARNPISWFHQKRSAEELITPSAENRIINMPYPKYLNAVMDVDMGAAVIVTDAQTARDAGLAPEAIAYLRGWADAYDVWYLSQRPAVDKSPALDRCANVALEAAGVRSEELSGFDLYSCFPSSIEVARDSFEITRDDKRPLTLTGGLPYHGGPGSNYVTHAIANALEHVRSGRGPVAVHGNGYYLTKHAVGVYSAEPPASAPDPESLPQESPEPTIALAAQISGGATIAAWTVPFDREGFPESAIVIADAPNGTRTIARGTEELTAYLLGSNDDVVGETIALSISDAGGVAAPA